MSISIPKDPNIIILSQDDGGGAAFNVLLSEGKRRNVVRIFLPRAKAPECNPITYSKHEILQYMENFLDDAAHGAYLETAVAALRSNIRENPNLDGCAGPFRVQALYHPDFPLYPLTVSSWQIRARHIGYSYEEEKYKPTGKYITQNSWDRLSCLVPYLYN